MKSFGEMKMTVPAIMGKMDDLLGVCEQAHALAGPRRRQKID
jgi:hypothetical protein